MAVTLMQPTPPWALKPRAVLKAPVARLLAPPANDYTRNDHAAAIHAEQHVSPWRWLEHAAWVIFEDIFLVMACLGTIGDATCFSFHATKNITSDIMNMMKPRRSPMLTMGVWSPASLSYTTSRHQTNMV